jgi:hypothetical protein
VRTFLKKITQLTPVAAGLAAGLIAVGIVSIVGGNYANTVVRSQLAPQKIFFPKPAEWPALKSEAGKQVLTGSQAKLYANDQILPDMNKIAGGKTYSEISSEWIAGGMKNAALGSERQTLFMGDTLRGLLLGAWGWGQIATYAILAGILLIIIGTLLFVLPVANYVVNLRPAREPEKSQAKVGKAATAGV